MIRRYKIHCITENQDKYWNVDATGLPPTTCPTNSAHRVDLNSVVVVQNSAATEVVTQYEKNDKDLKLARNIAQVDNTGAASCVLLVPGVFGSGDGRYVAGGYGISADYNPDDYVTIRVEDRDRHIAMIAALQLNPNASVPLSDEQVQQLGAIPGIGAFPNYPIVKSYTDDDLPSGNQGWYFWPLAQGNSVAPVGEVDLEPIGGYGFLPAGFYLIIGYQRPNGVTTGALRVNYWWGKLE